MNPRVTLISSGVCTRLVGREGDSTIILINQIIIKFVFYALGFKLANHLLFNNILWQYLQMDDFRQIWEHRQTFKFYIKLFRYITTLQIVFGRFRSSGPRSGTSSSWLVPLVPVVPKQINQSKHQPTLQSINQLINKSMHTFIQKLNQLFHESIRLPLIHKPSV